MSPVRILLSASFPRVSLQFRPWQRHLIAATDSSQTPCKLLPASCVRFLSMSRQRPLGVLSASSQSSLGLLSASSHCFSARMYCLDSHVEPWRPLRTSSHRRRTRRSLHAFIIFPALRVHIPRYTPSSNIRNVLYSADISRSFQQPLTKEILQIGWEKGRLVACKKNPQSP